MRVESLATKDGQNITLGQFTVLVGPNNVGKSQTLRDIHTKVVTGTSGRTTLIDSITVEKPQTFQDVFHDLTVVDNPTQVGQKIMRGIASDLQSGQDVAFNEEQFKSQFD